MGFFSNFYNWFGKNRTIKLTQSGFYGQNEVYSFNHHDKSYGIEKGYASNTDVFAIVNLIKTKAVDIPLKLYNGDEEVTDGEVFDFLMMPNDIESLKQFNEWALLYYLTTGNAVINKELQFGISGRVDKMVNLHYPCIDVESMVNESKQVVPEYYTYHLKTKSYNKIDPEFIYHIRYANPTYYGIDEFCGLSPLQAGYLSLISSNNLNIADASILKNKGASGVFSNESEVFLNDEQRQQAQEALDGLLAGADKFGKIIQSPAKTKYTQLGMSPADLKILESRVMKKRDLCSLYGVDSSLFNDPANQTYNNRKEANKSLYTNAVIPTLEKLVDGVWNPALKTWGEGYHVKPDLSDIHALQEDASEKATRDRSTNTVLINTLKEENISDEQKIQILMRSLNISEDEATNIVMP